MVTANSAPRFKDRSIMSDSYVEKYMRAKKRHEVTPKCLFGKPLLAETDEFLLQHSIEQMKDTKEVYEKYDLSEIADGPEKDNLFPEFEAANVSFSSNESSEQEQSHRAEANTKFQPKVVTEYDRLPDNNLFVPIDKVEPSGAVNTIVKEEKLTDYWQTSKRRRSSNSKEDSTNEDTNDNMVENPSTEDQNLKK